MQKNRSMPTDVLIPTLGYPDVTEAVAWLTTAFGFTKRWQVADHRAQISAGGTDAIAISKGGGVRPEDDHVMVRVTDVDAHSERARAHGGEIVMEPEDNDFGERQYTVRDFAGRLWCFSETIADVAPSSWGADES